MRQSYSQPHLDLQVSYAQSDVVQLHDQLVGASVGASVGDEYASTTENTLISIMIEEAFILMLIIELLWFL